MATTRDNDHVDEKLLNDDDDDDDDDDDIHTFGRF